MKPFKTAETYAADLQRAFNYFRRGGLASAEHFLARHDRALRTIIASPLALRLRRNRWRQIAIPRSTYAIFYREAPDFWFLGGVLSTVQDPDAIQARLLIREVGDLEPEAD